MRKKLRQIKHSDLLIYVFGIIAVISLINENLLETFISFIFLSFLILSNKFRDSIDYE